MNIRFFCKSIAIGLLSLNITSGFAYTPFHNTDSSPFVATLSLGYVWNTGTSNQTIFLTPVVEKTYTGNNYTQRLSESELFLGMQQKFSCNYTGQLGLAFSWDDEATLRGDIWDDASPQFDNYTYQYQLKHKQFALKAKLLFSRYSPVLPWISASLGVAFNDASSFTSTPKIYQALPLSNFGNYTTTAFTYSLGLGVQYNLVPHWQIGIGYQFADWGKSQLSTAPGQVKGSGPSLSHFYTNGLLVNLSFLASGQEDIDVF